jgi:hypothetical protein
VPQGEQGPQGPEGPPGQDGEDGSVSGYEVVSATDPNVSPSALCSSGKSPLGGGFLTFGGQTFAWQPILSLGRFAMRRLVAVALVLLAPAAARAQSPDPKTEVRAVIDRLFDAMRATDTTAIRSTFHADFRLAVTTFRDGQPLVRLVTADAFLASLASATEKLDEQISDVEIRVEDNVATVWNRYVFYVDGRADHCGIDAFTLVRIPEGWKILQVADTQRREGCGT